MLKPIECVIWNHGLWKNSGLIYGNIELSSLDDDTIISAVVDSGFLSPLGDFDRNKLSVVSAYPEKLLWYDGKLLGSVYLKGEVELYTLEEGDIC